jgi:uncharacterized membrane protein
MWRRYTHFFRRTFLAGLLILIPLYVTYLLVAFLFELFAQAGAPIVNGVARFTGIDAQPWADPIGPVINLLLSLGVIFLLGLVGANILGRRILAAVEAPIMRLPLVKSIYGALKQMVETFKGPGRSFQRVILVQYPRKGIWVVGFVVNERPDNLNLTSSSTFLTVFIPTTPNPTSGFLILVSPEEVVDLDYNIEEAFKFIVSSGVVGKDLSPAKAEASPTPLQT